MLAFNKCTEKLLDPVVTNPVSGACVEITNFSHSTGVKKDGFVLIQELDAQSTFDIYKWLLVANRETVVLSRDVLVRCWHCGQLRHSHPALFSFDVR